MGTRSPQCGPKVPGRFAFPGARNPRICSIWRFGKKFQLFSRNFPGTFLQNSRKDPRSSHSLLKFSDLWLQDLAICLQKSPATTPANYGWTLHDPAWRSLGGHKGLSWRLLGPKPCAQRFAVLLSLNPLFFDAVQSKVQVTSEECKALIFWGSDLFFSHALSILAADDLGDFSGILLKSPRIVGGEHAQSMRVKRSDSWHHKTQHGFGPSVTPHARKLSRSILFEPIAVFLWSAQVSGRGAPVVLCQLGHNYYNKSALQIKCVGGNCRTAKVVTKNIFTKNMFWGNSFWNCYQTLCVGYEKITKIWRNKIHISGDHFVAISARMGIS